MNSRYKETSRVLIVGFMFLVLLYYPIAIAQNEERPASKKDNVEEVLVLGERFEIDTTVAFDRLTESNDRGARLYKQGKYKEALPYLLVGAQTGFKMSQARVGAIYLGGLGDVKKDMRKGIGWLGVASEPITAPEIRNTWKRVLKNVSEDSKGEVAEIVAEYVALYGRKVTGTACEMTANTKSFVARLECTIVDEFDRFASDQHKAMVGCFSGIRDLCVVAGLNRLGNPGGGGQGPF